jgi:hypothetical protein
MMTQYYYLLLFIIVLIPVAPSGAQGIRETPFHLIV